MLSPLRFHSSGSATAAGVAVTVLFLLTGCSSQSNAETQTESFDQQNPQSWVLPVQAYLPTDQEQSRLSQAKKLLIGDCMKGFGFTWVPAPDLPRVGPKTLTDWRYGIHDMALAKERGYKPDAEEQEAYDAAVEKGAVDGTTADGPDARALDGRIQEVDGKKVPEGGCVGAANKEIDSDAVQARTAVDLGNAAFVRSQQEPEVVKAFAAWSACMKRSGYDYQKPLDASDDSRFSSPEVTSEEIATATTDITCRQKTKVAWTWFRAEAALQREAIEQHAEELSAGRKKIDAAVRNASRIVKGE
ncbi:hypothetical protein [Streptomyces sp. E2N166]|uniref:hypothetical protein n=1 Tax=Streptomyces sp. E2N166 TaxID=1851909 RepID=UPI001EE805B6|nr:hypothetical protein [Streptomyces sp. E2N166]